MLYMYSYVACCACMVSCSCGWHCFDQYILVTFYYAVWRSIKMFSVLGTDVYVLHPLLLWHFPASLQGHGKITRTCICATLSSSENVIWSQLHVYMFDGRHDLGETYHCVNRYASAATVFDSFTWIATVFDSFTWTVAVFDSFTWTAAWATTSRHSANTPSPCRRSPARATSVRKIRLAISCTCTWRTRAFRSAPRTSTGRARIPTSWWRALNHATSIYEYLKIHAISSDVNERKKWLGTCKCTCTSHNAIGWYYTMLIIFGSTCTCADVVHDTL